MKASLLWHLFSVEARKRLAYRTEFWINSLVGVAIHLSVYWAITRAMFSASGQTTIGGYSSKGMLLYYVFVTLASRVSHSNEADMSVATDIYDGSLSRYLLYPVPYSIVKYVQEVGKLAPQMLQLLVFGAIAPFVVGIPADVHITVPSILLFAAALAVSHLLHFVLLFPLQAVAFWADNVWSLSVAFRFVTALFGGLMLPLELFPEWTQSIIRWLPFPYLYSMPVRVLLGRASFEEWAAGIVIALVWCGLFVLVSIRVWGRGDLRYTGVGI